MQDLTTTITFSVTTIVVAAILLYQVLWIGRLQNKVRDLTVVVRSLAAPTVTAEALTLSGTMRAHSSGPHQTPSGQVSETAPPASITTTSPGMTAPSAALAAASPIETAPSPVFVTPPAPPAAWDSPTSPLNSSNPSVAVVVLTPTTVPPAP